MRSSLGYTQRWVLTSLLAAMPALAAETGPSRYTDRQLFSRGEMRIYAGEHLEAVSFPVGGIATGAVHIDGNGVRHAWTIFPRDWLPSSVPDKPQPTTTYHVQANRREQIDTPEILPYYMSYVPDSFFAVRVATTGQPPLVRVLQTVAEGPFAPMESLRLKAAYPLAWYEFEDKALPVRISLRTWNPLIPCDLRDSAIPCALYDLTAQNPTNGPIEVSFLATQQNAVGFTGHRRVIRGTESGGPGRDVNRIRRTGDGAVLHLTSDLPKDREGYGDMALATSAGEVSVTAAWHDLDALLAGFAAEGRLRGPAEAGPTETGAINGALAHTVMLAPGQRYTVTFVLSWYFPNACHGGGKWNDVRPWEGRGHQYTNWWPNAAAVAEEVLARYQTLERRTLTYQETLYETNLPYWMLQRISSQVTPIRTRTVWWDADGYFGAWEGMSAGTGSCPGNCSHVWQYAQAYGRLFPELARRMREQDYRNPLPDGGLLFRQTTRKGPDPDVAGYPATDGQLGVILASYREHLMSTDSTWLRKQWPSIRQALQFVIDTWDADGDGALNGIQHTTLDCKVGGSTSWLGSMYLAALRAGEEMARTVGDEGSARRYRQIDTSGAQVQDATLFNGEYFIQRIDGKPENLPDYYTEHGYREQKEMHGAFLGGQNYFNGCEIDQLLGQWWANQLHLGWLYPEEHVRTALRSLFAHNYFPTFANYEASRVPWIDPDDGGMVVLTFPHGLDARLRGKKMLGYGACTLTGFEYAAAAAMIQAGLLREGFTVVRTISERYDGRMRTGLHKTTWGWSGNPFGDDESGKWYARAQSAWSLLLAAQGYVYDGPGGILGFDPVWRPEDHRSFFTVAAGFGLFRQQRTGHTQTSTVEIRDGRLQLRQLILHLPASAQRTNASIQLASRAVAAGVRTQDRQVELTFPEPIQLAPRQILQVQLNW